MDALLEELHCSDVAAGDLGYQVGQAVAEAEGADVQTAGLPRTAPGVEVHVANWSLPRQIIQTSHNFPQALAHPQAQAPGVAVDDLHEVRV